MPTPTATCPYRPESTHPAYTHHACMLDHGDDTTEPTRHVCTHGYEWVR